MIVKTDQQLERRQKYQREYQKAHKEHLASYQREYYALNHEAVRVYQRAHSAERKRKTKDTRPLSFLFTKAQCRARAKNIPFTIIRDDLTWTGTCPVFGIPLFFTDGKVTDNTPSIDKIVPELGYVPGNVAIISMKANRLKNNASIEELRRIVTWMEKSLRGHSQSLEVDRGVDLFAIS